jgi:hypothetical protein
MYRQAPAPDFWEGFGEYAPTFTDVHVRSPAGKHLHATSQQCRNNHLEDFIDDRSCGWSDVGHD